MPDSAESRQAPAGRSDGKLCYLPTRHVGRGAIARLPTDGELDAAVASLKRYATAMLNDAAAADGLVESVLTRAGRSWRRRSGADLRIWLLSFAHALSARFPARSLYPTSQARREVRDMQRALCALPLDQRGVLLLVSLEGLTYEEAALVLGVPPASVRSRLIRARENLRLYLEDARPRLRRVK